MGQWKKRWLIVYWPSCHNTHSWLSSSILWPKTSLTGMVYVVILHSSIFTLTGTLIFQIFFHIWSLKELWLRCGFDTLYADLVVNSPLALGTHISLSSCRLAAKRMKCSYIHSSLSKYKVFFLFFFTSLITCLLFHEGLSLIWSCFFQSQPFTCWSCRWPLGCLSH